MGSDISLPSLGTVGFKPNNQCFRNGSEQNHLQTAALKTKSAYCFRTDVDLMPCKHCSIAMRCRKECQVLHWGRHRYVCQAAGQRTYIDISIPVCDPDEVHSGFCQHIQAWRSPDPCSAPPPPRDGTCFIVKMQTHDGSLNAQTFDSKEYASSDFNPEKATVIVYDRSRNVDFEIADRPN